MKSSLKNPTKAESRRMEIIKREIGCIACWIDGHDRTPADAHHLISEVTGRRISHSHTIPLCPHVHHKGHDGIHKNKIGFRGKYGTDSELLELTDRRVNDFEANTIGGTG